MVFDTCQGKYGNGRDDDKRQQNRPKPLPSDVASQPPHDCSRCGDSQQSWECRSFAIAWHEEWKHRHDEDAKAETRGALNETRTDAQQEYGKDYAAQILNYPNNRCKGTKNIGFLTTFAFRFNKNCDMDYLPKDIKNYLFGHGFVYSEKQKQFRPIGYDEVRW